MDFTKLKAALKLLGKAELGAPLVIVMILAMIMLPLPAFLLDLLFTFNIAFSLIILLVVVYTLKPLEFASFPTVILLATIIASGVERGFDTYRIDWKGITAAMPPVR